MTGAKQGFSQHTAEVSTDATDIVMFWHVCGVSAHSPAGELDVRKNLSKDFEGATRMALMRALKWVLT